MRGAAALKVATARYSPRTILMPPTGFVLRNYHCKASARFAYWIADRLNTARYSWLEVDPNEGFGETGTPWFTAFKEMVARGTYVIALLSPALANAPDEDQSFKGIALLSELLHFWDGALREDELPPDQRLLIPILIDCSLADLARPEGKHEQLQNIAAPLIEARDPLYVSSASFYGDGNAMRMLADTVAERMGCAINAEAK